MSNYEAVARVCSLVVVMVFGVWLVLSRLQPSPTSHRQIHQTLVRECYERNTQEYVTYEPDYWTNMTIWGMCDADSEYTRNRKSFSGTR